MSWLDFLLRKLRSTKKKDFEEFCLMVKPDKINLVSSAIIIEKDKVLLTKAKNRTFYYPPGGLIDDGETAEEACVREVKEELGVEVAIVERLESFIKWNINEVALKGDRRKLVVFYFLVKIEKGILKKVKNWDRGAIEDFVWVNKEGLEKIKTFDEVKSVCEKLL